MEFFQTRQAKLFLIVMAILAAMAIGVWKQLETTTNKPVENQIKQENEQQEATMEGEASQNQMSEEEKDVLANTTDTSSAKAYELGNNAVLQDKISAAIEQYKISAESSDPEIRKNSLYKLADCYSKYNATDNLIDIYEQLLELEQNKISKKEIYEELGIQYNNKGVYDKAIESYKASYDIEKTPDSALKLCEVYEKMHDEQGIQNIVNDFTAKNPGYRSIFNKFGSFQQNNYVPQSEPQQQEQQEESAQEGSNSAEENNQ